MLSESIDTAMDKAENGNELDVWSELRRVRMLSLRLFECLSSLPSSLPFIFS